MPKTIVCDLDGVLCEEGPTFSHSFAKPIKKNINLINDLYFRGNEVMIFTGRSWGEFTLTKIWLQENDVHYTTLICGKPTGDFYVDDRNITLEELEKCMKITST